MSENGIHCKNKEHKTTNLVMIVSSSFTIRKMSDRYEPRLHCRKKVTVVAIFHPEPGCHLPDSPWPGIIKLIPGQYW
jgi:hypothetical protein